MSEINETEGRPGTIDRPYVKPSMTKVKSVDIQSIETPGRTKESELVHSGPFLKPDDKDSCVQE